MKIFVIRLGYITEKDQSSRRWCALSIPTFGPARASAVWDELQDANGAGRCAAQAPLTEGTIRQIAS